MLIFAGFWAGCVYERTGEAPPPPDPPPQLQAVVVPLGPEDPLAIEVDELPAEPVVHDAAGEEVALERFHVERLVHGWRPPAGWLPGTYEVVGAVEPASAVPVEPIVFEIGTYGQGPVDPADLVGGTWVAHGYLSEWDWVIGLIGEEERTAGLVIDAVDGDEVTFWVLGQVDGAWCAILHDVGVYSEDGARLDWARDALAVDADGKEVSGHDLGLSVVWEGDANRAYGSVAGLLDTRNLDPDVDECELLAKLGIACADCPDHGADTCLPMAAQAIDLRRAAPLDPETMPLCGVDPLALDVPTPAPLSCEIEPLDLDFDVGCGCRTAGLQGGLPLLVGLALAIRRRRTP